MTERVRVVIAEDHYLFREGIRKLLEASGSIEVVAAVGKTAELLVAVDRLKPDAAVVDIRMPPDHRTEGIQAAKAIRATHPEIGIVVLSQYANAMYALELFQDGTSGLAYLLKDRVGNIDELTRAVITVVEGGSVIDPQVVEGLLARGVSVSKSGVGSLTQRETEVLREMGQGKSNTAISEALYISESAIEKHINAILAKLGLDPEDGTVNRRVAAVLTYLRSYDPTDIDANRSWEQPGGHGA